MYYFATSYLLLITVAVLVQKYAFVKLVKFLSASHILTNLYNIVLESLLVDRSWTTEQFLNILTECVIISTLVWISFSLLHTKPHNIFNYFHIFWAHNVLISYVTDEKLYTRHREIKDNTPGLSFWRGVYILKRNKIHVTFIFYETLWKQTLWNIRRYFFHNTRRVTSRFFERILASFGELKGVRSSLKALLKHTYSNQVMPRVRICCSDTLSALP